MPDEWELFPYINNAITDDYPEVMSWLFLTIDLANMKCYIVFRLSMQFKRIQLDYEWLNRRIDRLFLKKKKS
jgi:hypothetical protein